MIPVDFLCLPMTGAIIAGLVFLPKNTFAEQGCQFHYWSFGDALFCHNCRRSDCHRFFLALSILSPSCWTVSHFHPRPKPNRSLSAVLHHLCSICYAHSFSADIFQFAWTRSYLSKLATLKILVSNLSNVELLLEVLWLN